MRRQLTVFGRPTQKCRRLSYSVERSHLHGFLRVLLSLESALRKMIIKQVSKEWRNRQTSVSDEIPEVLAVGHSSMTKEKVARVAGRTMKKGRGE